MLAGMKLVEKGRFVPPPQLKMAPQRVSEALAAWEGMHARTHWYLGDEQVVDGADFYVGEHEVGHIHLYSEAHIMLPLAVAEAVIKAGLARPFRWMRACIVFQIDRVADVEHALWLFQLSYDRGRGVKTSELLERVAAYVAAGADASTTAARRRA